MNRVIKVVLNVENLNRSLDFWSKLLGMKVASSTEKSALLTFGEGQTSLELVAIGEKICMDTASGRIAFACLAKELPGLQARVQKHDARRIHTKLVTLDTPGKATVSVVILTDPDWHEICFVGDEAFRKLSKIDANAEKALLEAIQCDWSDEWEEKKKKRAAAAPVVHNPEQQEQVASDSEPKLEEHNAGQQPTDEKVADAPAEEEKDKKSE